MGKEEPFSNIFDAAKRLHKKLDQPQQDAAPSPPLQEGSEDLDSRLSVCKARSDELKKKIEAEFSQRHISPRDIDRYLETPTNFSDQDWKAIERTKAEVEQKLEALLPRKRKAEASKEVSVEGKSSATEKSKKGYIKKQKWIPMK